MEQMLSAEARSRLRSEGHMGGNYLDDSQTPAEDQQATASAPIADAGSMPTVTTTWPDEIKRHNISDEELDMLDQQRRDDLHEVLTLSVGVAAGALPGAIAGIFSYASGTMPLDALVQIVVFSAAVAVAFIVHRLKRKRGKTADDLKEQIRARTKKRFERTHHN